MVKEEFKSEIKEEYTEMYEDDIIKHEENDKIDNKTESLDVGYSKYILGILK